MTIEAPDRSVCQHTGEIDPAIGSTLPEPERAQFRGHVAAAKSVGAWIDLTPDRALVGCTPAMVAQVAVDAYLRMGGGSATDADGLRTELDSTMQHNRDLASLVKSYAVSEAMWHAERDEQRERADEWRDRALQAETRLQELEPAEPASKWATQRPADGGES